MNDTTEVPEPSPHAPCNEESCGYTCWFADGMWTKDVIGGYMGDGEGPCRCPHHATHS